MMWARIALAIMAAVIAVGIVDCCWSARRLLRLVTDADYAKTYLGSTRSGHEPQYKCEMLTCEQHERLLEELTACTGMVAVSGYRCDLYDRSLADWNRVDLATTNASNNPRVESVWCNFDPPEPTLMEADA